MKYITDLFLTFMIYSFIGYICEMIYSAIQNKKVVNRGFLCGPILPIYGLGAIFMLYTLTKYNSDPLAVFVLGAVICSILEYVTSVVLEKIFHNMWWDYFDYKFNLNGRICLLNAILFGIGGVAIVCFTDPMIDKFLMMFTNKVLYITAFILLILFISDIIYSVIVAYNLRNRLIIVEELKNQKIAKIPKIFNDVLKKRVAKFKIYPKRLLRAFPKIKSDHFKEFKIMKTAYKNKKRSK